MTDRIDYSGLMRQWLQSPETKPALEDMAASPLMKWGYLAVHDVYDAELDSGPKRIRVSVEMIGPNDKFDDE